MKLKRFARQHQILNILLRALNLKISTVRYKIKLLMLNIHYLFFFESENVVRPRSSAEPKHQHDIIYCTRAANKKGLGSAL